MQTGTQNTSNTMGQTPLTDQERAFDLLYHEKALMANIASEVVEGSQPGLRNVMNDLFTQVGQDQLQIFQAINSNGWYQLKDAPAQEIQTAKQKYQQMQTTL